MLRWQWFAVLALAALAVPLYLFDPATGGFPACPFRSITGLLCPGCGSQRAVHELLHGNIGPAFHANAFLPISIPLLSFHAIWAKVRPRARPLSAYNGVVLAWALLIIGWGVGRNIL